jgi:hypothetical protein
MIHKPVRRQLSLEYICIAIATGGILMLLMAARL